MSVTTDTSPELKAWVERGNKREPRGDGTWLWACHPGDPPPTSEMHSGDICWFGDPEGAAYLSSALQGLTYAPNPFMDPEDACYIPEGVWSQLNIVGRQWLTKARRENQLWLTVARTERDRANDLYRWNQLLQGLLILVFVVAVFIIALLLMPKGALAL